LVCSESRKKSRPQNSVNDDGQENNRFKLARRRARRAFLLKLTLVLAVADNALGQKNNEAHPSTCRFQPVPFVFHPERAVLEIRNGKLSLFWVIGLRQHGIDQNPQHGA
jgi:hypothetical protein